MEGKEKSDSERKPSDPEKEDTQKPVSEQPEATSISEPTESKKEDIPAEKSENKEFKKEEKPDEITEPETEEITKEGFFDPNEYRAEAKPLASEGDNEDTFSDTQEEEPVEISETDIKKIGELVPVDTTHRRRWWQKIKPGAKREGQIIAIQSACQEMMGAVQVIKNNLDSQVRTQEQMLEFMSEIPQVSEKLKNVRETTQEQKELLGTIKKEMKISAEQNQNLGENMNRFNATLYSMDNTTQRILEGTRESEDNLRDMLDHVKRRQLGLTLVLIILLLSVSAGFYYILKKNTLKNVEPPQEEPAISLRMTHSALPIVNAADKEKEK